jgi:hypothetical protein
MLKRAIALEVGNEGVVGDDGFIAALGDDCEIVQILEKLLVVGDRKNDGSSVTVLVSEILQGLAHTMEATLCLLRCREREQRLTTKLSARRPTATLAEASDLRIIQTIVTAKRGALQRSG